ncbi:3-dehydroquinate synthase family protein, partial [Nocardioides sp.]|uniref:3-dehydroquinate synthase family protein n=1 Tax=Nocardioides sp. TaxID=35761 RepID=UPI00321AFA3A
MSESTGHPADSVLHVGGASPYDVVVGHHLAHHLPGMVGAAARIAVVCPESLEHLVEDVVGPLLDRDVTVLALPDGEEAKTAEVAVACWEALGEEGFTRSDVVVTLGGGATTDVGGFVAASWLRGVRVVHVPTTLLAMVDAAVGGKTGINTAAGKNLVGAFHEPSGVLCDLALLETLPREELVAGLGEVLKCGFIADPEILQLVEQSDPESLDAAAPGLRALGEPALQGKIVGVVDDLRGAGG